MTDTKYNPANTVIYVITNKVLDHKMNFQDFILTFFRAHWYTVCIGNERDLDLCIIQHPHSQTWSTM